MVFPRKRHEGSAGIQQRTRKCLAQCPLKDCPTDPEANPATEIETKGATPKSGADLDSEAKPAAWRNEKFPRTARVALLEAQPLPNRPISVGLHLDRPCRPQIQWGLRIF